MLLDPPLLFAEANTDFAVASAAVDNDEEEDDDVDLVVGLGIIAKAPVDEETMVTLLVSSNFCILDARTAVLSAPPTKPTYVVAELAVGF